MGVTQWFEGPIAMGMFKKGKKKAKIPSKRELKELATLSDLEEVARKLSVDVIYDQLKTEGIVPRGGKCIVKGKKLIIIEKKLDTEEKVDILARALSSFPLDEVFIPPNVRDLLVKGG